MKYLKIKSIAEEEVNRLLSEEEPLLDLPLDAVIEALRMSLDRYRFVIMGSPFFNKTGA